MLYLANFLKGSLQDEADQFFQALFKWDVAKRVVTRSAICQARKKIKHGAFIALRDAICKFLDRRVNMKSYCGCHVLAIDGSTIRPPDLLRMRTHFGQVKTTGGFRAMARASLLFDVLNRVTYDAILGNYHVSEQTLAWEHLETANLPKRCLILMDSGYVSFQLLKQVLDLGHQFCVRVKSNLNLAKELKAKGWSQGVFKWKPSSQAKAGIPKGSPLRRPIWVRVIDCHVGGPEPIYLMTSLLDRERATQWDLAELYHQRWQVEESYKAKKCRLMVEEFSGTSPEIVLQDFHAKVFGECLTEALTLEIADEIEEYSATTQDDYRVCFAQALAKMKNTLPLLFLRPRPATLVTDLLCIFSKGLTAVVPGRKFKRKHQGKCGKKLKSAARAYRMNR